MPISAASYHEDERAEVNDNSPKRVEISHIEPRELQNTYSPRPQLEELKEKSDKVFEESFANDQQQSSSHKSEEGAPNFENLFANNLGNNREED